MEKRLQWVREHWDLLTNPDMPVTYLDEKWFYVTNRRRKIKRLPLGDGEAPGIDFVPSPKMRSRRFPVKSMFMGVVAKPQPDRGFSGRIHLERISEDVTVARRTTHQRFSDDRLVNQQLKNGEWRKLVPDNSDMTSLELAHLIGEVYELENAVVDRLEFAYETFVGDGGNTKTVYFNEHQPIVGVCRHHKDPAVQPQALEIEDVRMKVRL